jgi:G3E family GTPase
LPADARAADGLGVVVLTGFLGSGKTTLLASLLRDPALGETAVIVNEIGEIPIDHHLLRRVDERTVLLANGCVCCSLRGDLADELRDLLDRRARGEVPPFRRVVVETTGLADPAPIVNTILAEPVLKSHYRLEAVVTTVDGVHGLAEADREHEWTRQTAAADRLCVTKTDVADPGEVAALERRLARLNPLASILRTPLGRADAAALLAPVLHDPRGLAVEAHAHDRGVSTFSLVLDRPLDWIAFGIWLTMLLQARGNDVLRVKGLLNVGAAGPVLLNGVQHVFHPPVHLEHWPDTDERSRIVFIGRNLDRAEIERSLAAFDAAARV